MDWKTLWKYFFIPIVSYPCLTTCYHQHSTCYPFINYHLLFYILFLFISHFSSYLPWTVGYPFINYDLSMRFYELSIHQLATNCFSYSFFYIIVYFKFWTTPRRWKNIDPSPHQISNKNIYKRNYKYQSNFL